MSDLFLILKNFSITNPDLVTWTGVGLILILGLISQIVWIKECMSDWKLKKFIKSIGLESLHNVTIPDGMDGSIFIEHLILTPKKILLLGVKKYRGLIFAANEIDLWTQVIGNKSYKFNNPLRQLESDALALNSKIENSKIEVKVLFINGSDFPKGKPDNVVSMVEINELSRNYADADISEALRKDWNQLLGLANDMVKGNSVLVDEENTSGLNLFSLTIVVTILLFWLAWRLM